MGRNRLQLKYKKNMVSICFDDSHMYTFKMQQSSSLMKLDNTKEECTQGCAPNLCAQIHKCTNQVNIVQSCSVWWKLMCNYIYRYTCTCVYTIYILYMYVIALYWIVLHCNVMSFHVRTYVCNLCMYVCHAMSRHVT